MVRIPDLMLVDVCMNCGEPGCAFTPEIVRRDGIAKGTCSRCPQGRGRMVRVRVHPAKRRAKRSHNGSVHRG